MIKNLHQHILYHKELILPDINSKIGYDYVICGNRIILRGENPFIKTHIHLQYVNIRGLDSVDHISPTIELKYGKIPDILLKQIIDLVNGDNEQFFQIYFDMEKKEYALFVPEQKAGPEAVKYSSSQKNVVAEFHTHPNMKAFFSEIDDRDELGFKIYGVLGTEKGQVKEIMFRIGVYGYFQYIYMKDCFEENIICCGL